ncbi:ABC transporter ATP-binding protein [Jiangella sp. DSM 45060]|uniref:ABC transporter ATP-binding protein n=1 Tax=Jiangella sp. DSM 45060 TaxID=1798224 RepID=UPI00087C1114|nr:ABC transporter ATP-binding protein [Jiangella sp. DSM 45060]SDS56103.1 peptide/nickel transport system ATP-binding protein [Jiangella sp. DSM 45060]
MNETDGVVTAPVLSVDGLDVTYANGARAVRELSLDLGDGECLALVGESGCGKTTVARALLGLLPRRTRVAGSVRIRGTEVVGASSRRLRRLRGTDVAYVAQDPYAACDPLRTVAHHVEEGWRAKGQRPPDGQVTARLAELGIEDAQHRARLRPHQWSGGMLQRATIAGATVHGPALTVADEATSALDADLSDGVLSALRAASNALLLVSHDLALVAKHADRVAVMYHGRVVETGRTGDVIGAPRHPYTRALLLAAPRPGAGLPRELPGTPPSLADRLPGCSFAPRCAHSGDQCRELLPLLTDGVACHAVERS